MKEDIINNKNVAFVLVDYRCYLSRGNFDKFYLGLLSTTSFDVTSCNKINENTHSGKREPR